MSRPEPEDRAPLVYVGATVGWAAGEVFPGIFVDVMDRVGNRGATRAAAAVALIEGDATEREARGEAVREDGFFDARGDERLSQAEELLEAVLRQAADAVEEEKLPFLARIYTAVERDPDVSPGSLPPRTRRSADVSAAGRVERSQPPRRARKRAHHRQGYPEEGTVERDPRLRLEIVDLINQQIVGAGDEFRVAPVADPLLGLLPRSDLSFGQLRLLASNSSA